MQVRRRVVRRLLSGGIHVTGGHHGHAAELVGLGIECASPRRLRESLRTRARSASEGTSSLALRLQIVECLHDLVDHASVDEGESFAHAALWLRKSYRATTTVTLSLPPPCRARSTSAAQTSDGSVPAARMAEMAGSSTMSVKPSVHRRMTSWSNSMRRFTSASHVCPSPPRTRTKACCNRNAASFVR